MLRNPQLYSVGIDESDTDPQLTERRADLAHSAATLLDKHSLIKYDRRTGNLQATDLGRIASAFYVTYNTLATFNDHLRPTMVGFPPLASPRWCVRRFSVSGYMQ
jgi:pre-mRNA-splicing helicase BRR2